MRRILVLTVAACSSSAPHANAPASPPAAASAARAPVPAVAATAPPVSEAKLVVADREPRFSFRDPDRRKKLEAAFLAVEKRIEQEMKNQGLPGLAFGIVIDGELAYSKGF